jgi:hypothetical protein
MNPDTSDHKTYSHSNVCFSKTNRRSRVLLHLDGARGEEARRPSGRDGEQPTPKVGLDIVGLQIDNA